MCLGSDSVAMLRVAILVNLSFRQRQVIRNLKNDTSIVILPADKGRASVVMNKEYYASKMQWVLRDGKYTALHRDPTVRTERKIAEHLKSLQDDGHIDDRLRDRLTPRYSNPPPQMYGLPKIHKEGCPMGPIVSAIGSPSYGLAKELSRILAPLAGHMEHTVKNTTAFTERIRGFQLAPEDQLVSFDVTSLFTQVPINEAMRVAKEQLNKDHTLSERTSIPVSQLVGLIELCLRTTYFQFQDDYFEQTDGAAIYFPLSPVIANLFVEDLEQKAI